MNPIRTATHVLASLILSACAGVPVESPRPAAGVGPLPDFAASPPARVVAGLAIDRWWLLFADPSLDDLMVQALAHNHDIERAVARVREAEAGLEEVRAARWPSLDLQAQSSRSRPSGDAGLPGAVTRTDHQVGLGSRFDVDLWGRLASGSEASRQRLLAQEWARAAVEWRLTAQLAEAHFSLLAVQRQIDLSMTVRDSRARTLSLRRQEQAAGSASEFETRRAEAELAGTDASLAALRRQRVTLEATLALLSGRSPSELALAQAEAVPLEAARRFDPVLPQGGAIDLLVRRPDLREIESRLLAARADVAAARSATLPALRLSGNLGSDVLSLSNLFSAQGFVGSLAASLSQSLFDGGANRARIEQAQARGDALLAEYRQAVLAALLELREAYAALDIDDQAQRAQSQRVAALQRSRALARIGVDAGALAGIDLLDAERSAYQAQLDEVAAWRDRLIGQVAVMKALGGGHSGLPQPKT